MCLPRKCARWPQRTFQLIGMWNTARRSSWLLSGEPSRSRALAKDLDTRFPEDSAVQFIYLPQIRALLALNDGSKEAGALKAIELLQIARPYERGIPPSGAPMFIGHLLSDLCAWSGLPGRTARL